MQVSIADSFDEQSLRLLVDTFYGRVRDDAELGPIFERAIGTDGAVWEPHLQTMTQFWMTVLLHKPLYKGNPLMKHAGVRGIAPEHFVRWLELFNEVAHEVFTDEAAVQVVGRARAMGYHMSRNLFGEGVET